MTSVGEAAMEMIQEIRRQFREIPGLMEGTAEPDTAKCVDIATTAALKKMLMPGIIAVASTRFGWIRPRCRSARRHLGRRIARLCVCWH